MALIDKTSSLDKFLKITDIPLELLDKILKFLNIKDFVKLSLVSKQFYEIVHNSNQFINLYDTRWISGMEYSEFDELFGNPNDAFYKMKTSKEKSLYYRSHIKRISTPLELDRYMEKLFLIASNWENIPISVYSIPAFNITPKRSHPETYTKNIQIIKDYFRKMQDYPSIKKVSFSGHWFYDSIEGLPFSEHIKTCIIFSGLGDNFEFGFEHVEELKFTNSSVNRVSYALTLPAFKVPKSCKALIFDMYYFDHIDNIINYLVDNNIILRYLEFKDCQIDNLENPIQNVKELKIVSNSLTNEQLTLLKEVESLYLNNISINDLDISYLMNDNTKLKKLTLNAIYGGETYRIEHLKGIEYLDELEVYNQFLDVNILEVLPIKFYNKKVTLSGLSIKDNDNYPNPYYTFMDNPNEFLERFSECQEIIIENVVGITTLEYLLGPFSKIKKITINNCNIESFDQVIGTQVKELYHNSLDSTYLALNNIVGIRKAGIKFKYTLI